MAAPAVDPQMAAKMAALAKLALKKDVKAGTIEKANNVNGLIQTIRVLNRSDEDSTISDTAFGANTNPNAAQFIKSDSDEELLILVEFKEDIDLETISFHACLPAESKTNGGDAEDEEDEDEDEDSDDDDHSGFSAPKKIFLYKVESLNKDFEDALGMKADVKVTCDATKLGKHSGHVLNLKKKGKTAIKFRKCSKIMIFIASNQDDKDQTYISGIKFTGNVSPKTDMSKWEDACKR